MYKPGLEVPCSFALVIWILDIMSGRIYRIDSISVRTVLTGLLVKSHGAPHVDVRCLGWHRRTGSQSVGNQSFLPHIRCNSSAYTHGFGEALVLRDASQVGPTPLDSYS